MLLRWKHCSQDYNRYIQKVRRLHSCPVEYFRVVEEHKDSFPHIHCLLQFPDARIRCTNSKYFDNTLYQKWKSLWTHGLSDYQKPKRSGLGTLSYLMKYLIKNTTSKTIWNKILSSNPVSIADVPSTQPTSLEIPTAPNMDAFVPSPPTHINGVKLASWSRNFDWSPLSVKRTK